MKTQTYHQLSTFLLIIIGVSFSTSVAAQRVKLSAEEVKAQESVMAIQKDERVFEWVDKECDSAECTDDMKRLVRFSLNGSPDAQVIVALAYATGEGVEQNLDLARQHLKRAIRNNDPRAWYIYSNWLKQGISVEVDLVEAEYAFQRALRQDHPAALFEQAVRKLDLEGGTNQEVVALLEKASKQKHQPAQYLLAQLLAGGVGVPVDAYRSAELFTSLSKWNYKESRVRLAALIDSGKVSGEELAQLQTVPSPYTDVEVIQVSGQRITMDSFINELANTLHNMGVYDGVSTGTRIRGQVCETGFALCRIEYSRTANSPAATALGALTGRAGF